MPETFTNEEIQGWYNAENNSITDVETIRRISLFCMRNPSHNTLLDKIKREYQFAGLYPEVMNSFDITPEHIEDIRKNIDKQGKGDWLICNQELKDSILAAQLKNLVANQKKSK